MILPRYDLKAHVYDCPDVETTSLIAYSSLLVRFPTSGAYLKHILIFLTSWNALMNQDLLVVVTNLWN